MKAELSVAFRLNELLDFLGIGNIDNSDSIIKGICTDSREASENDLFFALAGKHTNGSEFVSEALKKGAYTVSPIKSHRNIYTDDPMHFLLMTASFYKSKLPCLKKTIAITGSVGKSTTKEYLKHILSRSHNVHANYQNYNNHIGVPLTVFSSPKNTEMLITEAGMNHTGEIAPISNCVKPDISIITNIGTSHIGNLGNRKNIAEEKSKISTGNPSGRIIVPKNEPLLAHLPNKYTYSICDNSADFVLEHASKTARLISRINTVDGLEIPFCSEHMLKNLCCALAVAVLIGDSDKNIKEAVKTITPEHFGQRLIKLSNFSIFDDSYNSSLESLTADLAYMKQTFSGVPLGAFIGDILELGNESEKIHTEVGKALAASRFQSLYLCGKYSEFVKKGAMSLGFDKNRIFIARSKYPDEESAKNIQDHHFNNEVILFKASHDLEFHKIANMIKERDIKNDR